ncbi:MAG: hypothetical protein FWC38_03795 [Proteobacteria bacterium]|nr:hypothetical protein [Pseudomonadota bacterium]MCL2307350.1 hypothetical protein [Pseudomonadota bacterium]
MNHYDPDKAPDPEQWLALDEQTRITLAKKYHRAQRIKLPSVEVHAMFHSLVESQIAENLGPVVRAMDRLAAEGLSRHESIHAIGSVLLGHIHNLLNASDDEKPSAAAYAEAVERLTVKSWHDEYGN